MNTQIEQEHQARIAQREENVAGIRATARRHAFEAAHVAAIDAAKRRNEDPVVVALDVAVAMLAVGEALASARRAKELPTPDEVQIEENVNRLLESAGFGPSLSKETRRAASMLGLPMLLRLRGSSVAEISAPSVRPRLDRGWRVIRQWILRRSS